MQKLNIKLLSDAIKRNMKLQEEQDYDIVCTNVSLSNHKETPLQLVSASSVLGKPDTEDEDGEYIVLYLGLVGEQDIIKKLKAFTPIRFNPVDVSKSHCKIEANQFYEDPSCEGAFFCVPENLEAEIIRLVDIILTELLGYSETETFLFKTWYDNQDYEGKEYPFQHMSIESESFVKDNIHKYAILHNAGLIEETVLFEILKSYSTNFNKKFFSGAERICKDHGLDPERGINMFLDFLNGARTGM